MSTARRPQTNGLTEKINETMQSLLRCYCVEAGCYWASRLDVIEFQYNSSLSESAHHTPFEVYYDFQPAARVDRLLPLTGADKTDADRLQQIADTRAVVKEP